MPTALENPVLSSAPPHKLWTREECALLEQAGVLELERYELVRGELVLKMGKNYHHMLAQMLLFEWLFGIFGFRSVLQDPTIDLHPDDNSTSEPQPDLAVLHRPFPGLSLRPRPEHLRMVAEVSDSSLSFDLTVKAELYARAGIAEYWVVDLVRRRVVVHRAPEDGRYRDVAVYSESESVGTIWAEATIRVGDLLQP